MDHGAGGFTLIELLVVAAILSLLLSVLLPALGQARRQARIVCVHADFRQIGLALEAYRMGNRDKLPPTRMGCGETTELQLPEELAKDRYLSPPPSNVHKHHAEFPDIFRPRQMYRCRAPGPVWYNDQFFDVPTDPLRPRSWLWVPDDFPRCGAESGYRYHELPAERRCPARYAPWSDGPDAAASRFPRIEGPDRIDESQFPLPRGFWLQRAGDTGLITHFIDRHGHTRMSP